DRSVRSATKVVEMDSAAEYDSVQRDRRSVFESKTDDSDATMFTILRTQGNHLHFIESESLQSALDFEKLSSDCSIDFRNFTYPSAFSPGERVSLVDGKLEPTRDPEGQVDKMGYFLIGEDYGDVAGDP